MVMMGARDGTDLCDGIRRSICSVSVECRSPSKTFGINRWWWNNCTWLVRMGRNFGARCGSFSEEGGDEGYIFSFRPAFKRAFRKRNLSELPSQFNELQLLQPWILKQEDLGSTMMIRQRCRYSLDFTSFLVAIPNASGRTVWHPVLAPTPAPR
jgi:hypothetical protein